MLMTYSKSVFALRSSNGENNNCRRNIPSKTALSGVQAFITPKNTIKSK